MNMFYSCKIGILSHNNHYKTMPGPAANDICRKNICVAGTCLLLNDRITVFPVLSLLTDLLREKTRFLPMRKQRRRSASQ